MYDIEQMPRFIMAPNLGAHPEQKIDHIDTDSNSSGSEEEGSSSDEASSDSDMDDVEDLFVATPAAAVDQMRNRLFEPPNSDIPVESTAVTNNASTVAVTGPTPAVHRPPSTMKRLRNMLAAVKPPEVTPSSGNSGMTVSTTTVHQPIYPEAITPVTPVTPLSTSFDAKAVASTDVNKPQQLMACVTATTVTTEMTDTPVSHHLPRKSGSKRMTSVSSKPDRKNLLSEDSSSNSEGEESGEVTNSESEDDEAKPKPPKQPKWDNTHPAIETPETSKLQLICSFPKHYMQTAHTPATTPKSPVSNYYVLLKWLIIQEL